MGQSQRKKTIMNALVEREKLSAAIIASIISRVTFEAEIDHDECSVEHVLWLEISEQH
jgi:hypothetical protein